MSPASQGALEVERYIGSCLISSTVRPSMHKDFAPKKHGYSSKGYAGEQCQAQYATGWAGTPLISMTSTPRRNSQQRSSPSPQSHNQQLTQSKQQSNSEQQLAPGQLQNSKSPLVRLAIHTQGAPLILTGRFHRAKTMNPNTANNAARCPASRNGYDQNQRKLQTPAQLGPKEPPLNATNIDSLSVASDESSNNSENSLPRIIKPRKRRKKDRKPMLANELNKQNCPEESALTTPAVVEPAVVKTATTQCYESGHYRGQRRPGQMPKENSYGRLHSCPTSSQEVVDTRQQRYAYRHVQVKVLDDNRNVIVPLPVRQLKGYRANSNSNANPHRYESNVDECYGSCQCRYCEPSALIWDVDPTTYGSSQYLAPYPSRQLPVFLSSYTCHDQFYDDSHHPGVCLHRDGSVAVLRRSWSDPASYFSDDIPAPQRDVGVIGDRGQSDLRTTGAWRPDVSSPSSTSSSMLSGASTTGSQGLEVSTEIVTSPNGHRDLEIKFYSSSPSSSPPEEDKVGFSFAEEDAEEEFSDIWSYHESKLQQDFRTLLQAEE